MFAWEAISEIGLRTGTDIEAISLLFEINSFTFPAERLLLAFSPFYARLLERGKGSLHPPDLSLSAGRSGCASGAALRGASTVAPNRGGRSGGAARECAPVGCEFWISPRHAQRIEAVSNRIAAIV